MSDMTNELLADRGVALPLQGQSTTSPQTRAEKGLEVQKQIVGADLVEKLYATALADQQHIQRLLSANCFGDHVARGGIDIATREAGDRGQPIVAEDPQSPAAEEFMKVAAYIRKALA